VPTNKVYIHYIYHIPQVHDLSDSFNSVPQAQDRSENNPSSPQVNALGDSFNTLPIL
jgi:hypothetical protein